MLLPATPGWVSLPLVVGGCRHSCLGFVGGGGVWCVVSGGGVLVGLWLVCGVVGPSPLLAEVPVCYSPPLLAGFRWRRWCVVCGVWRCCVGGVVAGVWCGWSLATPGGGSCVLLPTTPGWVSLPVVVGGPRHSWLGSAGGGGVWCVVCGVWCVAGVPRHSWRSFLCATPRHSWLGFAAGGGGRSPPLLGGVRWRRWCVSCGVWCVAVLCWLGCGWARTCSSGRRLVCVCVRVRALLGGVGRAGLPGAFWCTSPFPLAALSLCFAWPPPGWGCPPLSRCCCRSSLRWRCVLVVFFFFGLPLPGSPCARAWFVSPAWPLAALWWLLPRPPPLLCLAVFVAPAWCPGVFFFFPLLLLPLCAPVVSGFLWFPAPGAPGLGACVVCFVGLPLLGSPCACPSFVLSAWPLAAPWWLLPPPPPFVSRGFRRCRSVLYAVLCCASLGAVLRRAAARCVAHCCAVVCCVALVWCRCLLPVALGPCALRRCVLRCSPALCALCCVCFVVARWCVLLFAALLCALCVPGCCAVCSLCSLLCAVLCFAVLVRSRCAVRVVGAVAGAWCCGALLCVVLFPVVCRGAVLGLLARGCLLVVCFGVRVPVWPRWSASLWLVWFAVVPCFPVSCSVVLCCRVVLCCCALLSCCAAVRACFALLWAVVLCCVVLLVGCAVFCPVVVSACCGALFLVPCVPCLLRSVRCGALLCWLWCPASLCRVLWRCAVVWCCAVVLCCRFAVLFVFALPSCGLSCGASVVCAVVGASCCGVSLCLVVSPWAFCGVVVLLWCVLVSCCAVRCTVVSCALCRVPRCRAALRCCAGWLCCAVVCAAGVCFSFCPLFLC